MLARTRYRSLIAMLCFGTCAALAGCSSDSNPAYPRNVTGQVRYTDGSAAGGVLVALHFRAPITGGNFYRLAFAEADGRFVLPDVDPGSYVVSAYDFGTELVAGASLEVPPGSVAGESSFVDLTLDVAGTFTGTVTLEADLLHHDTDVRVQGLATGDLTDSLGRYRVPGLPPGAWTLIATHRGWVTGSATDTIAAAGDTVEVAAFELQRE